MFGVGDVFSLVAVETTSESGNTVGTRMREGPLSAHIIISDIVISRIPSMSPVVC